MALLNAPMSYADAGVSIEAGNALIRKIAPMTKATARKGADSDIGGFGGIFDLATCGYDDPLFVAANDGVGTKLKIAIATNKHDSIGIDLVAMCVNDLIVQGAEPLFFLDYFATSSLDVEVASDVIAGVAAGCRQAGCALIGGETAEMPDLYQAGDYDLAGFAVGAVERPSLLPRKDIEAGDVVLGLASDGIHANGFSLVRRLVEGIAWDAPDPTGKYPTLADALLVPTRIYVKPLLQVLQQTQAIKGFVHITGGGFQENLPRILSKNLGYNINLDAWETPDIFKWLQGKGDIERDEMLRTFNCGIGMVAIVAATHADDVAALLTTQGERVFTIGHITDTPSSSSPPSQVVQFEGDF